MSEPVDIERCPGSGILVEYSTAHLVVGLPACCPRCGQLTTLVADRDDVKPGYAVPMFPDHERQSWTARRFHLSCAHESMDGTPWANVWVCFGCNHLVRTYPPAPYVSPPPSVLWAHEILELFRGGM